MKRISFIIIAASLALISCNKTILVESDNTITVTAGAAIAQDGGVKVSLGTFADNKYPILFDADECIVLNEFVGSTWKQHVPPTSFVRDSDDYQKASVSFTLEEQTGASFSYFANYPGAVNESGALTNPTHGYRAGKENNFSYILNHTVSQVPLADGPDPGTFVMTASAKGFTTQQKSLTLDLRPVVAFAKMTVTKFPELADGESITKITVTAPSGKLMTGRFYENISTGEVTPYNANNVKPYVMIDPMNITFNTTGFDVWFTTFPISLVKDDILMVEATSSKGDTYTSKLQLSKALSFEAGKVSAFTYDWSKGQPKSETKILTFDFSTCPAGWPSGASEYQSKEHGEKEHLYTLDGVDYYFSFAVCTDVASTSTRSIAWGYNGTAACEMYIIQAQRYFGLPRIEGWKLVQVSFPQALGTNSGRYVGVTSKVCENTKQEYIPTIPEGKQACATQGTVYSFALTESEANVRYYLAPSNKGTGLTTIKLVYEKTN